MSTSPTPSIHPGWLTARSRPQTAPVPYHVLVRELRLKRGLSQEAFAELVGLERSTIARLESGERPTTLGTCIRLATGLDLNARDRERLIESAGYLLTPEGE